MILYSRCVGCANFHSLIYAVRAALGRANEPDIGGSGTMFVERRVRALARAAEVGDTELIDRLVARI